MVGEKKNIFIVGIKGVAMANLALMLQQMGKNVQGADVVEEFITDENIKNAGIAIQSLTDTLPLVDLVIYSAAHGGTENSLVKQAQEKNIATMHQEDVLAEIMDMHEVRIAVCGSHGKTTTTAMLAFCLEKLGVKPTYMVGTSSFSGMPGGAYGDKKYCVMEADEYAIDPPRDNTPKFLKLNPTHIICTNIDFDHPDVYKNVEEVQTVFQQFFEKSGAKVYNNEDILNIPLFIPGEKNKQNASKVVAVLTDLGFDREEVIKTLASFTGAKRRFEQVAHENDIFLYDDYAHHPAEIIATIDAARAKFPGKRIIVIFQPHTFSRTRSLQHEFVDALSKADHVFLVPTFASARESTAEEVDLNGLHIEKVSKIEDLRSKIESFLRQGDIVFTMGAGDIYKAKNDIIGVIKSIQT